MDADKTGKFIAACRKAKGLTQKALAEKLGVTNKAVSKWESGQGMPDISILTQLAHVLDVSVDALLNGRAEACSEPAAEPENVRKKKRRVTAGNIAGGILIAVTVYLLAIQCMYPVFKKTFGMEYIWNVLFYMINGVILLFIFAGGVYIKKIRPIFMKKAVVAILAVLFFANGAAAFVFNDGVQSFVSLSPDLGALTVVKKDKNGRTTVYEKSEVPFVKPVDTLPFTMSGKPKLQWLADDVCAVTYKSPDDGGTHQYVVTYGDRGGAVSYYYVWNAALGNWRAQGKFTDYSIEFRDGSEGGVYLHTPDGDEYYNYDDCLQYGTLAVVFPRENPKWTVVLNNDCEIDAGTDLIKDGGTMTLCRISMDDTAPIVMERSEVPKQEVPMLSALKSDYYINGESLSFTGDYGETWIDSGLTAQQLSETLEVYRKGNFLAEGSFYSDGDGLTAFFYGKTPTLRITKDNGATWTDYSFDREMPRTVTRRCVRFLDKKNGYAAIGTDWSMGTGEALYLYWTHDGGKTWDEYPLPTVDGEMLGAIAFADEKNGIVTMQRMTPEDPWLVTYFTEDCGKTFKKLELPWKNIPSEITYLTRVDDLAYENGKYILTMGQGDSEDKKVRFISDSLSEGWILDEVYTGAVHTYG